MPAGLKAHIADDMKTALRAGDRPRLGALRLILAAVQEREIGGRRELDDTEIVAVLDKLAKQRRESLAQYRAAGRQDLADTEQAELDIILGYLPAALSDAELEALIDESMTAAGAASVKDMGKVMGQLKPKVQGRADMAAVSAKVKARLEG